MIKFSRYISLLFLFVSLIGLKLNQKLDIVRKAVFAFYLSNLYSSTNLSFIDHFLKNTLFDRTQNA